MSWTATLLGTKNVLTGGVCTLTATIPANSIIAVLCAGSYQTNPSTNGSVADSNSVAYTPSAGSGMFNPGVSGYGGSCFYTLNSGAQASSITWTLPAAIYINVSMAVYQLTPTAGGIRIVTVGTGNGSNSSAWGASANAVSTGSLGVSSNDAILIGIAMDLTAGNLTIGTVPAMVQDGAAFAQTIVGHYAFTTGNATPATWTTSVGSNNITCFGVAFSASENDGAAPIMEGHDAVSGVGVLPPPSIGYVFLGKTAPVRAYNAALSPGVPAAAAAGNLLLLQSQTHIGATYAADLASPGANWVFLGPAKTLGVPCIGFWANLTDLTAPVLNWGAVNTDSDAWVTAYSGNPSSLINIIHAISAYLSNENGGVQWANLTISAPGCLVLLGAVKNNVTASQGAAFNSVTATTGGPFTIEQSKVENSLSADISAVTNRSIQTTAVSITGAGQTMTVNDGPAQSYAAVAMALFSNNVTGSGAIFENSDSMAAAAFTKGLGVGAIIEGADSSGGGGGWTVTYIGNQNAQVGTTCILTATIPANSIIVVICTGGFSTDTGTNVGTMIDSNSVSYSQSPNSDITNGGACFYTLNSGAQASQLTWTIPTTGGNGIYISIKMAVWALTPTAGVVSLSGDGGSDFSGSAGANVISTGNLSITEPSGVVLGVASSLNAGGITAGTIPAMTQDGSFSLSIAEHYVLATGLATPCTWGTPNSGDVITCFGAAFSLLTGSGGAGTVGVAGTGAVIEASEALAGVGFVTGLGVSAITEGADTASGVGTVAVSSGSDNINEISDTPSGAGTVSVISGTDNINEGSDAVVSIGTVMVSGNGAVTEGSDAIIAIGFSGAALAAIIESSDIIASVGAVSVVSGADNINEGSDVVNSVAGVSGSGIAAIPEGSDAVSSTGTVSVSGSGAVTEDSDLVTGTSSSAVRTLSSTGAGY